MSSAVSVSGRRLTVPPLPVFSSAFLCNTRNELALLYNDISVLESHHAAFAYKLTLSDDRVNIFKSESRPARAPPRSAPPRLRCLLRRLGRHRSSSFELAADYRPEWPRGRAGSRACIVDWAATSAAARPARSESLNSRLAETDDARRPARRGVTSCLWRRPELAVTGPACSPFWQM